MVFPCEKFAAVLRRKRLKYLTESGWRNLRAEPVRVMGVFLCYQAWTTSFTPGTCSFKVRSIPIFRVMVDIGQ